MSDDTTIRFASTFDELKKMGAEDARIMSVVTLSGKGLGAYYARNEQGGFTLRKQVCLEPGFAPDFKPEAAFTDDHNHIAVRDAQGNIKGFFALHYADISARFGKDFIRDYATPPVPVQQVYKEMAGIMANKAAPELFPPDLNAKKPAQDTPAERNALFKAIADKLDVIHSMPYTTADGVVHTLPDDNFHHTHGVSNLAMLTAGAINDAAQARHEQGPFNADALQSMGLMGIVHDIGKAQIRIRLNSFELGTNRDAQGNLTQDNYLTPQDRAKMPEEQKALHALKDPLWRNPNVIHPLLGYVAFSIYPEMAEAFALHHLSLYRDQKDAGERERCGKLGLMPVQDISRKEEVPYISQIFRVCDVTDAMINNSRCDPVTMLRELAAKTKQPNHMGFDGKGNGLASIDPDILCFMINHGVMRNYLAGKTLAPLQTGGRETGLQITEEYMAEEAAILTALGYTGERRARVEAKILADVRAERMMQLFPSQSVVPPAPPVTDDEGSRSWGNRMAQRREVVSHGTMAV